MPLHWPSECFSSSAAFLPCNPPKLASFEGLISTVHHTQTRSWALTFINSACPAGLEMFFSQASVIPLRFKILKAMCKTDNRPKGLVLPLSNLLWSDTSSWWDFDQGHPTHGHWQHSGQPPLALCPLSACRTYASMPSLPLSLCIHTCRLDSSPFWNVAGAFTTGSCCLLLEFSSHPVTPATVWEHYLAPWKSSPCSAGWTDLSFPLPLCFLGWDSVSSVRFAKHSLLSII